MSYRLFTFLLSVLLIGAPVWAQSHKGLTFQGFIKDSSGQPVTASGLTMTMRLLSPNECILLEETHSGVNIAEGFFTVVIAKGVRGGSDRGYSLAEVLSNSAPRTGLDPLSGGAGSCSFLPSSTDGRSVNLDFQVGADVIKANFNVRANAFSVWAENSEDTAKLEGKTASQFVQTNSGVGLTQSRLEEFIQAITSVTGGAVRWNGANFVSYNPADATYLSAGAVMDTHVQSVSWSKLSAVPGPLSQIGGLTCVDGKILKRSSGVWVCADDAAGAGGTADDLTSLVTTGIVQRNGVNSFSTVTVNAPLSYGAGALGVGVGSGLQVLSGNIVPDFGTVAGRIAEGNDSRFPSAACGAGNFNRWSGSAWVCAADVAGGSPAGSDQQVQFNDGGVLGGGSLTFDKTTRTLTVGSSSQTGVVRIGGSGALGQLGLGANSWISGTAAESLTIGTRNNLTVNSQDMDILFETNMGLYRTVIKGNGSVGIGTSDPASKLDVAGEIKVGSTGLACDGTTAGAMRYNSGAIEYCNGTSWAAVGGGAGATPPGAIMAFSQASCPSGWLAANGAAVSRTTYAALFAQISTMYGAGNGSTTFNVPDYRGYFLRGWANGSTVDPDRASRTNRGDGTTGDNVGTKQEDEIKSHTHSGAVLLNNPQWTGSMGYDTFGAYQTGTQNTGAAGGNESRPKNINVLYCIKE